MSSRKIKDSTVLITGGTGSFGSAMVNHLLENGVGEVRIFSRDEAKQDAMRHQYGDRRMRFYIGDVRDAISVQGATKGCDLVFHAAALKQVPSAEFFPLEAAATNVQGSANVARAAIEAGVKSAVFLSTDKAVYPINAMGMTKALMEKTVLAFARNGQAGDTKIAVTRYGNVMGSRGSVIPLFIKQINGGQAITITEPQMTRFLMTLSDSVDLVQYAFENSESGDIYIKKAPAATVADLVQALIEVFNVPNHPVDIIGIRHGEKKYESLLSAEEMAVASDKGKFFKVPLDTRTLNYSIFFDEGTPSKKVNQPYDSNNAQRLTVDEVKSLLMELPEVLSLL